VDEYIISGNATQSAIRAGYSEKTARSQGQRLLTKVDISESIKKRMEELQDEKILTQKQILVMLSEIASGVAMETIVVTTKIAELKPDPLSGKSVKVYNEIPQLVEYPTKNSDRNKALELLGKRYGMWTEKVSMDATDTTITIIDAWSKDES
jgi:phage terminase small subunit